jgi:myo-inositol-1(or 4)-monophosphatase
VHATAELPDLFEAMFREVRAYLLGPGRTQTSVVQINPRGDATRAFDYRAEEIALDVARRLAGLPLRILTEERGEVLVGAGEPAYTLFLDPVDGSSNYLHGMRLTGFSVAAIPGPAPWSPADVACALIGDVFGGDVYTAGRGGGALHDGRPIHGSTCPVLAEACVILELHYRNRRRLPEVLPFLSEVKDIRYLGSASLELAAVARGAVDARIDLRGTSTVENWMAGVLLVAEAGGVVSDARGGPLAPVRSLTDTSTLVAAGNPALHQAILEGLRPRLDSRT